MSPNNTTPKLTRSEQSRINGAKSKGPITPEGKAKSSSNRLTHGFAATINVVLSIEDEPAFLRHLQGVRASLAPQNYLEETLVDQLANISWRQARLVALESALLDAQMSFQNQNVMAAFPGNANDNYFHLVEAWQALARPAQKTTDSAAAPEAFDINSLELLRRYQTSLDRQFRNTLLNLRQYRKDFAVPGNANLPIGSPSDSQATPEPIEPETKPQPTPQPTPNRPPTPARPEVEPTTTITPNQTNILKFR